MMGAVTGFVMANHDAAMCGAVRFNGFNVLWLFCAMLLDLYLSWVPARGPSNVLSG